MYAICRTAVPLIKSLLWQGLGNCAVLLCFVIHYVRGLALRWQVDLNYELFRWFSHDGSCAVCLDALQAGTDSNEQCENWTGLLMIMDLWISKLLEPNMPYMKWLKGTRWRCNYQKQPSFLTLDISQLYKQSFLPEAVLSLRSIDHSFTLCECI